MYSTFPLLKFASLVPKYNRIITINIIIIAGSGKLTESPVCQA